MNDRPFFVSIDGPKAVGKSTTLDCIKKSWNLDIDLTICIEKEINPNRKIVCDLLRRGVSDATGDRNVAQVLAEGRAHITKSFDTYRSGIVIIDRWYPSEAVFRRYIPFDECAKINARYGVWEPDIVLAMTCSPDISWKRAISRPRGLSSYVIRDFSDHNESTLRFNEAAESLKWQIVDTSRLQPAEVSEAVIKILAQVVNRMH